jgi:hypothetical protein
MLGVVAALHFKILLVLAVLAAAEMAAAILPLTQPLEQQTEVVAAAAAILTAELAVLA